MSAALNLDDLGRRFASDGGKPNVYFVSQDDKVVGVFLDEFAAVAAAEALGESKVVYVESRTREEVWVNDRYQRVNAANSDEEAERIASGSVHGPRQDVAKYASRPNAPTREVSDQAGARPTGLFRPPTIEDRIEHVVAADPTRLFTAEQVHAALSSDGFGPVNANSVRVTLTRLFDAKKLLRPQWGRYQWNGRTRGR